MLLRYTRCINVTVLLTIEQYTPLKDEIVLFRDQKYITETLLLKQDVAPRTLSQKSRNLSLYTLFDQCLQFSFSCIFE